ncbi:MAG: hypothetical protein IKX42_01295 [Fibrobacter sp.]|nr:hypothetical protein [Fibrobacter sp.]
MNQSDLLSFMTEYGIVIVIILLSLGLIASLIISIINAIDSDSKSKLFLQLSEDTRTLIENQNEQIDILHRLDSNLSGLTEQIENHFLTQDSTDSILDDLRKEAYESRQELIRAQRNIVSYFKEDILPEQVIAYFAPVKGKSIIISNQNTYHSFNITSLSVKDIEANEKIQPEILNQLRDTIEHSKEITIAPDERYTISLEGIPLTFLDVLRTSMYLQINLSYQIKGKQKELSVECPLGCARKKRYA